MLFECLGSKTDILPKCIGLWPKSILFLCNAFEKFRICKQNFRIISVLDPKHLKSISFWLKTVKNYWNSNQNICKGFDSGPKDLKSIDIQWKALDTYRICRQNIQNVSDHRPNHSKKFNFYAKCLTNSYFCPKYAKSIWFLNENIPKALYLYPKYSKSIWFWSKQTEEYWILM